MIRVILAIALLVTPLSAGPAHAGCANAALEIETSALSGTDVRSFEARFRSALTKVCDWWGPAFEGPYMVEIEDNRGPSMALLPAWRGERGHMLFRAKPVRTERAAIVHEIVHVVAPNANRFVAEGLATWAHQALGGEDAYPNYGSNLHALARPLADADMAALERTATPTRLNLANLDDRSAYLVAASFVGFLIETYGMEKFRLLYAATPLHTGQRQAGSAERWQAIFGKRFEQIVVAWRLKIDTP